MTWLHPVPTVLIGKDSLGGMLLLSPVTTGTAALLVQSDTRLAKLCFSEQHNRSTAAVMNPESRETLFGNQIGIPFCGTM